MSVLAVLDPAVELVHTALSGLAAVLRPGLGGASVAVALVLITMAVRLALVPLSIRVLHAERARRELAPAVRRARRRWAGDRARLARELQSIHAEAGVSPVAGLVPSLTQGLAMVSVYRLCRLPLIGGVPNSVLGAGFLGVPLSAHLPGLIITAGAGPAVVGLILLAALVLVARLTSAQQVRRMRESGAEVSALNLTVARLAPYGTVLAAAVVPVAVSLYLLTSTAWMVAERAVLPRLI
jgi:YidC/Oxa1 family membrane protein insertase